MSLSSRKYCGPAAAPLDMTQTATSRIRPRAKFFFEGEKKFFVKGVTYGPFKPDADGNYLGPPQQIDADVALMRRAGLNIIRIYHSPPRWFLDRCAAASLRVLVTLPWEKHIEFLRERSMRKQIVENVRAAVKARGHFQRSVSASIAHAETRCAFPMEGSLARADSPQRTDRETSAAANDKSG